MNATQLCTACAACAAILWATVSCGSSPSSQHEAASPAPGRTASCGVARNYLLTQADLPGYTQWVAIPRMVITNTGLPGHPPLYVRQYTCGQYYGFVINAALSGVYRQENNEQARKLGYPIGKWPYLPLSGQIVIQLDHSVLDFGTGLYQFASPQAGAAFIDIGKPVPVVGGAGMAAAPRVMNVKTLPGALVTEQYLGTDTATSDHNITIRIPLGDLVFELSLDGGRDLDWNDVLPFWNKAKLLIAPLESGR